MLLVKSEKEEVIYDYLEETKIRNIKNNEAEEGKINSKVVYSIFNQNGSLHGFANFLDIFENNKEMYSEISKIFNKLYFKLHENGRLSKITNKSQMLKDMEKEIFQIINNNPDEAVSLFNFFNAGKQLLKDESLLELINSGKGIFSLLFPEVFNIEFTNKIIVKKLYFDIIEGLPIPVEKVYEVIKDKKNEITFSIKTKIDYERISKNDLLRDIRSMYDIPESEEFAFEYSGSGIIKIDKKYGLVNGVAESKQVMFQEIKKRKDYSLERADITEETDWEEIDLDDKEEVNKLILDTYKALNESNYSKIIKNYQKLYLINKKLLKDDIIWKNLSIIVRITKESITEKDFKHYLDTPKSGVFDFKNQVSWCEQDLRLFKPDI